MRNIHEPHVTGTYILYIRLFQPIVSVFSLFYRYYHGICSDEIKSIIPPKVSFARNTRFSKIQHPYALKKNALLFSCPFSQLHITFIRRYLQLRSNPCNLFLFSRYKSPRRTTEVVPFWGELFFLYQYHYKKKKKKKKKKGQNLNKIIFCPIYMIYGIL